MAVSPLAIARALLEADDDADPYAAKDPYAAADDPYTSKEDILGLIKPKASPIPGVPNSSGTGNLYYRLVRAFERRKRLRHIKLGHNTWADFNGDARNVNEPGNYITVKLHDTHIAMLRPDGSGTYWNRGWNTPVTLDRISSWLAGGWHLYSWKRRWYWYNPTTGYSAERLPVFRQPFTDGDRIDPQGTLHPQASPVFYRRRKQKPQLESMGGKAGVYADLTGKKPEYYAKCPECGHVHGMYPTFAAAQEQKICPTCRHEKVMKYKSDLEKLGRPKKKRPVREEEETEDYDPKALLRRAIGDWVQRAKQDFAVEMGSTRVIMVNPREGETYNSQTMVSFVVREASSVRLYAVYKSLKDAWRSAVDQVLQELHTTPNHYSATWLEHYCDVHLLRQHLADKYPDILTAPNAFRCLRQAEGSDAIFNYLDAANFNYDYAANAIVEAEGPVYYLSKHIASEPRYLEHGAIAFRIPS